MSVLLTLQDMEKEIHSEDLIFQKMEKKMNGREVNASQHIITQ